MYKATLDGADQSIVVFWCQLHRADYMDAEVAQARGLQKFFGGYGNFHAGLREIAGA